MSYLIFPDLHEDVGTDRSSSWCAAGGVFSPEKEAGSKMPSEHAPTAPASPLSPPPPGAVHNTRYGYYGPATPGSASFSTAPSSPPSSAPSSAPPSSAGVTPQRMSGLGSPSPGKPPEGGPPAGDGVGGGSSLGVWGASLGALIPQGVDMASYLAGEAAALQHCFQQALPGQELLGHVQQQVASLHGWLQQESARVRRLEAAGSGMQALLSRQEERLGSVEHTRLPGVEGAVSEAKQELRATGAALRAYREQVESQELIRRKGSPGMLLSRLFKRVFDQMVTQASQMDVALLFLAKRILIWETPGGGLAGGPGLPGGAAGASMTDLQRRRAATASMLMVLTTEVCWRAHGSMVEPLPRLLRVLLAPIGTGLYVLRAAVWSAAFVIGAYSIKSACYSIAEAVAPGGGTGEGGGGDADGDGDGARGGLGGSAGSEGAEEPDDSEDDMATRDLRGAFASPGRGGEEARHRQPATPPRPAW